MSDMWGSVLIFISYLLIGAIMMKMIVMLNNLHGEINSRLNELLETTRALARAEGFKAGRKSRDDD